MSPHSNPGHTALETGIAEKLQALALQAPGLPAITIVHDLRTSSVVYMSPQGLRILDVTMEELIAIGPDYHPRFFNMEYAEGYVAKILGLLERNNNEETVSYVQQVRATPDDAWIWYQSCTKIFMRDDEGSPILVISNAIPLDAESYIDPAKAQRLMDENNFLRNKYHLFNQLTKREKEILRFMALGYSSGKMAKEMHISEKTTTTHRRNIKSKLKAETSYDITRFAQAFDLV